MQELAKRYPSSTNTVVTTTGPVPAAAYVRVSSKKQGKGFSPEDQEEAIRAFAQQENYDVLMLEYDKQSGHDITREGYQKVLDAVRGGVVHAVLVAYFDRFGRRGEEWIARAKELERAGCAFISVSEGKEQGGLMRYVRGGLNEEYSRLLAQKVRPAMERSVREAKRHHGIVPVGYVLRYPERTGSTGGRYQAGTLVPHPAMAPFVTKLFSKYAAGGASLRDLALWANSDPACPKSPKGKPWTPCNIGYVLRNPTYMGALRYNHERLGMFERSAPGDEFVVEGEHEALVDEATFIAVQERLDRAGQYIVRSRLQQPDPMGAGILRCAGCGSRMTPSRRLGKRAASAAYVCLGTRSGETACTAVAYSMGHAHEALLRQVKRLTFRQWDLSRMEQPAAPAHDDRADLARALEAARQKMRRHTRRFAEMIEDPTDVEIAEHRAYGAELAAEIARLQQALAALPDAGPSMLDLQAAHARFLQMDVPTVMDTLAAQGDEAALRDLLLGLVTSATIVERQPAQKSKWLRARVQWSLDVRALLDAGQADLLPDPAPPDFPSSKREAQLARYKRYAARKRAGLVPAH